jgi:hypothetical protein
VDGVVGEVLGDALGVAAVERLVVGADVIQMRDGGDFYRGLSIWAAPVRR